MDMSADTELLWPGAALLLLLGAAASLCVRCSRPGAKKSEKIYEQRSLQENQQSFAVARTYTLVREAWPGDTASNMELTRKDKLLRFSPSLEDSSSPRYQYFSKGSRPRSEEAYIDPTSTDYYNYDPFQKPVEDDDDTNSYENVLICKPKRMESADEGSEDYQNSASIQQWRESKKVMGAREPFIASPGPLLQSRSASTLPAALLGGASTCPEDQRAGHAAPGLGKDSYREPTSDRLPRASLGSGGSRRGPVPRTGDSCVPLPALKTSYYMGVCVLFFRFGF